MNSTSPRITSCASAPLVDMPFPRQSPERSNCWLWLGSDYRSGYGRWYFEGKYRRAHRVALHLSDGFDLASNLHVCHSCDVRNCVNPAHLFVGTNAENHQDAARKGRKTHKLNPLQVRIIRRLLQLNTLSQMYIGVLFEVSDTMINMINTGKRRRLG